jgi:hypothetical protein
VRLYGGAYSSATPAPLQRRIMLAGADPYQTFSNPLLRSAGALFVRPGFHYHASGGPGFRGFAPDLGGRWAAAVNLDASQPLLRWTHGVLREVAITGFFDGGLADTLAIPSSPAGRAYTTLYDAGLGLATRHVWGDLAWRLRLELPLVVNRWDRAADFKPGDGRVAFRWQVSLEASR